MLFKGGRCKFHGGKSLSNADRKSIAALTGREFKKPGPKTPEGISRSFAARDAGRDRYWGERREAPKLLDSDCWPYGILAQDAVNASIERQRKPR